jgi:carboxyl-terminal processing protease
MMEPMTRRLRALSTALGMLLVASACATQKDNGIIVASNGDMRGYAQQATQAQLVNLALRKLEASYYKPIDPQTPIKGEEAALAAYLKTKHIANVTFPNETATGDTQSDGDQLVEVLAYTQDHYGSRLGSQGSSDLTDAALRGILHSVNDPYTVYLSPKEIQGLQESLSGGNFGGIGVYIYQLKDGQVVVQPITGMPAARAGIKPGEVVDTVGGKTTKGLTLDRVEQLIRGPEGTRVTLDTHIYKKTAEHHYAITRAIIHVPTVLSKMEDGYMYIRLSDFGTTSAEEVKTALLSGKANHAKGYILDLRDNGGGLVDAAVKISSYFVPHGTIVATIDRAGNRDEQDALGTDIDGLSPLVILVNKYTASASEITSGALQDYHLATLIGTRTFGKGVVQSIYSMPDLGALKITTARYVTPLGRDIQHKGILPDIVIDQSLDPGLIDTPADKQLAAAKAQLRKQLRS